jgi:hypothetical protein
MERKALKEATSGYEKSINIDIYHPFDIRMPGSKTGKPKDP